MKNNYLIKVFGKVQGVGYRIWCQKVANELKLYGSVRNCNDSTVEIRISANEEEKDKFLERCYIGTPFCIVKKIEVLNDEKKIYKKFNILR